MKQTSLQLTAKRHCGYYMPPVVLYTINSTYSADASVTISNTCRHHVLVDSQLEDLAMKRACEQSGRVSRLFILVPRPHPN